MLDTYLSGVKNVVFHTDNQSDGVPRVVTIFLAGRFVRELILDISHLLVPLGYFYSQKYLLDVLTDKDHATDFRFEYSGVKFFWDPRESCIEVSRQDWTDEQERHFRSILKVCLDARDIPVSYDQPYYQLPLAV